MLRLPVAAAAALAFVAAACTGTTATTGPATTSFAATSTTTIAAAAGNLDALPGRIVVIDDDGNVVTMLPDGSEVAALTDDAGPRLQFSQPTWSPDGTRVAWTQVDGRDDDAPAASVHTASFDGTGRTSAATPLPVFYMYWDPTSSRLAYLHSGVPTLESGIVDVAAGGDRAETIDTGQPYYFSWSPDGSAFLAHVGTGRLDVVDAGNGGTEPVDAQPGTFQAPSWGGDGTMLYATAGAGDERLVIRAAVDAEPRELLAFQGFIWFVRSPDDTRVAFQILTSADEGGQSALADQPPQAVAAVQLAQPVQAPVGALAVLDLPSGEVTTLTADSAVGFFWSATGTLVSLHLDGSRSGWFRWRVWGDDPFIGTAYRPSLTMARDYLPFFDQYAQSLTPWAPDGSAFVYAGRHEDGGDGVWVQPAAPGSDPTRISGGSFAAWSPAG